MLPDIGSKSKSDHSGSVITSVKNAIGVVMKSQSSRSQSRVDSSIAIDDNVILIPGNGNGNGDIPPSSVNPYNSSHNSGERESINPSTVALQSGLFSQRKDHSSRIIPTVGGGNANGVTAFPGMISASDSGD